MTDCFVTGASGFIGSHLCSELSKREDTVVAQVRDVYPTPWGEWLQEALKNCVLVKGDVTDASFLKRVIAEYNPQNVLHLAAQSIVSTAKKDPVSTFEINVQGTVNLLEACRQLDIPTIYVQSTDKVYGNRMDAEETHPLVSSGIYETSKTLEDLAAQAYADTYGLNIIIGRACNTFGFDMAKRIIPNTIRSCIRGEAPIIYEGEETLRQYIYVKDLTSAILHLTEFASKEKGQAKIFNIGTDDVMEQAEVVRRISNYFPLTPRIVKREKPLKEISRQSLNWRKLRETGWNPEYSFWDGVEETIQKFQECKE